jgi:hypothetical protein
VLQRLGLLPKATLFEINDALLAKLWTLFGSFADKFETEKLGPFPQVVEPRRLGSAEGRGCLACG